MSLMTNIENFAPFWFNINIDMLLIVMMLVKQPHFLEFVSSLMLNFF